MSGESDETSNSTRTLAAGDLALDPTARSPGNTPGSKPRGDDGDGDDDAELAPGTRFGRYEIGDVLGSGGMGVVYAARDPELDRALAIKVLRPLASSVRARERLLDEARAMAKLRHPGVVPVFDVGATAHGVYIVMPLLAGGTLHDWLVAAARPWREVLDRFAAAGRGLAAAHAAGLIHRDFKPRNVMVGDAGEVLVGDFGIAAQTDRSEPGERTDVDGAAVAQVTSIAGTPAYMAPEQARGDVLDARADQYSFCVSVWEGLCGGRPDPEQLRNRSALSERGRATPAWLLDALRRGMAPSPAARWPSITALLDHLERRRRRPRRLALAVVALTLVGGAASAAVVVTGGGEIDRCARTAAPLDAVWTSARRNALAAALGAVDHPAARTTADRVVADLDATTAAWRAARQGTCRATWTEGAQSAELLDLRMRCLDGQLASLDALLRVLGDAPDGDTIDKAPGAVAALPDVHACDDEQALRQAYPLPSDAAARATLAALEPRMAEVDALISLGRGARGLAASTPLLAEARALGHPPLLAHALHNHAAALNAEDQQELAITTFREAVQVAATARDDQRAQQLWTALMYSLTESGHADQALAIVETAKAAVARAGNAPTASARLLNNEGTALEHVARYDEARARLEEALALLRPLGASGERDLVIVVTNLARVRGMVGDEAGATTATAESVTLSERVYGHDHPLTIGALTGKASDQQKHGDRAGARATIEDALGRAEARQGPDHAQTADVRGRLAIILMSEDDFAAALPMADRAVAVLEKSGDVVSTHALLHNLCSHLIDGNRLEQALTMCKRAADAARRIGPDHPYVALESIQVADTLVALTRYDDAAPLYRDALTVVEAALGPEHVFAIMAKNGLARTLVEQGRGAEAIAIMQDVLAVLAKGSPDPSFVPQGRFTLARARWAAGQHAAARADARAALDGLRAINAPPQVTAELETWLTAHARELP
ncbi:MAG TPA: serine/threonine-protein kinase [Kofleriaceae bacterium]|nr:serine/threonine-protein kinase [Kofleriaceae bacterium]